MRRSRARWAACAAIAVLAPLFAVSVSTQEPAPRPIEISDVAGWRTIGNTAVSNDGRWFAYRIGPAEGDAQVVAREIGSDRELTFDIGDPLGGASGGQAAGPSALEFSADSKWLAFTTNPTRAEAQRLRRQRRPVQSGAMLVNLATGDKTDVPKIRRFAFSGDNAGWLALQRYPAQAAGGAGGAAQGAGSPAAGAGAGSGNGPDRPRGSDLVLRDLSNGKQLNVGNVADFSFSHAGTLLALTIDAQDKVGNGIQLRHLPSGRVAVLDSGEATYERPTWTDKDDGLAVLKGTDDRALRDKRYAVLGFTRLADDAPAATAYDPKEDPNFPEGMTISPNRDPRWTEDLQGFLFGIHEPRPREGQADAAADGAGTPREGAEAARPADGNEPANADDKVDLVLWHWKDTRLQSQQEVQAGRDRQYSYLALYRLEPKRFLRLADDDVRTVDVAPHDRWAIGFDDREYELLGNLDGRRYRDVYAIDLQSGERTLAGRRMRWYNGPSPDGQSFLFYDDGQYRVYSMETKTARVITADSPVSFVDTEDDHNVVKPPTAVVGWASDSRSVLLNDNWDVWRVPVSGGPAINLTGNGRRDTVRYQRRFALEPPEDRDKGIDLGAPLLFQAYGEWTKKGGIARVDPDGKGVKMLTWDDASYSRVARAEKADVVVYTRETSIEPADFFVTDGSFAKSTRLTDQRPQMAKFEWSSGVRLVPYTSEKGDKLQAALFLPANYEEGKSYPTLVYFYEKMSQTANTFATPTSNGFNRALYNSQGYAVLMPDITYRVNDPGMSAVWCMVPAVKAAIATGVVDARHVGITGHSWGGYQTAFLVTQTNIFAAAVAGAPLTNMVSMYSLIYKNTGGTNQAIFESSQGRFKGGYWDNWDAYYRNSPVFFAKNVTTPLIILHNDKDGAVDFTQGVEYYNTLRRLQKPVIMLEYVGENHGLRKPANQRDYSERMREFFDHYLKGAPAPGWMTDGVPHLKMEEHLKERAAPKTPVKKSTTSSEEGKAR